MFERKAVLVYQCGIANVFEVRRFSLSPDRRQARRLYQGDFETSHAFACGLGAAGYRVRTAHCNRAGDIVDAEWSANLDDAPFADRLRRVRIA